MGLFSSRRPNTTREAKEQGRRRKETAAPPTVCLSGAAVHGGGVPQGPLFRRELRPTRSASSWSRASLLRTVVPSRQPGGLPHPGVGLVEGHADKVQGRGDPPGVDPGTLPLPGQKGERKNAALPAGNDRGTPRCSRPGAGPGPGTGRLGGGEGAALQALEEGSLPPAGRGVLEPAGPRSLQYPAGGIPAVQMVGRSRWARTCSGVMSMGKDLPCLVVGPIIPRRRQKSKNPARSAGREKKWGFSAPGRSAWRTGPRSAPGRQPGCRPEWRPATVEMRKGTM